MGIARSAPNRGASLEPLVPLRTASAEKAEPRDPEAELPGPPIDTEKQALGTTGGRSPQVIQLEVPKQVIEPTARSPVIKQAPQEARRSPTRSAPEPKVPGASLRTASRASPEGATTTQMRQGERLNLFSFQRPTQKTPLSAVKQKNTSDFLSDWNF